MSIKSDSNHYYFRKDFETFSKASRDILQLIDSDLILGDIYWQFIGARGTI